MITWHPNCSRSRCSLGKVKSFSCWVFNCDPVCWGDEEHLQTHPVGVTAAFQEAWVKDQTSRVCRTWKASMQLFLPAFLLGSKLITVIVTWYLLQIKHTQFYLLSKAFSQLYICALLVCFSGFDSMRPLAVHVLLCVSNMLDSEGFYFICHRN